MPTQTSDNNKRIAKHTSHPYVLLDGRVVVCESGNDDV